MIFRKETDSPEKPVFKSKESGIRPLLQVIHSEMDVKGCYAADKIVGKAAALLYAYMGVSEVYAEVLGKEGRAVLESRGIRVSYRTLTDRIINRRGDDICPMEKTVKDISDPGEALCALEEKLGQMESREDRFSRKDR